jgi:enamine deaminase RidA (YjgF/YER057c/UK114 family)
MTARPMASHGMSGEERWGYSQAICGGGLVHVAGQVPRDGAERPLVGPLPVTFGRTLDLVESALAQVGCGPLDLVYVQAFVFERDRDEAGRLYRERLGGVGSALSMVIVDGLNHPDYALEVSATAIAPASERTNGLMQRESISTGNPLDERLGRATAVRVGNLVYVSGQPSVGPDGTAISDSSFLAHYTQAFANFLAAVEAAGGTGQDVVSTHTFVTDPVPAEHAAAIAEVHRKSVGNGSNRPASTLVRVSALSVEHAKVEITGVAVVDPRSP